MSETPLWFTTYSPECMTGSKFSPFFGFTLLRAAAVIAYICQMGGFDSVSVILLWCFGVSFQSPSLCVSLDNIALYDYTFFGFRCWHCFPSVYAASRLHVVPPSHLPLPCHRHVTRQHILVTAKAPITLRHSFSPTFVSSRCESYNITVRCHIGLRRMPTGFSLLDSSFQISFAGFAYRDYSTLITHEALSVTFGFDTQWRFHE